MTDPSAEAERLADRLLDEIRLGIAAQFDESRTQLETVIEEHAIALSVEEQLRHSGMLDEITRLREERDTATRRAEELDAEVLRTSKLAALDFDRHCREKVVLQDRAEALEAEVADLERRLAEARAGMTKLREAVDFAHGWIGGLPREPSFEDKRAAQAALEMAREAVMFDANIEEFLDLCDEALAVPSPPVAEASGESDCHHPTCRVDFCHDYDDCPRRALQPTADHTATETRASTYSRVDTVSDVTSAGGEEEGRGNRPTADHTERARESKEATHQRYYDAFHAWFMSEDNRCDFWSECNAPEALATVAVEIHDAALTAAERAGAEKMRAAALEILRNEGWLGEAYKRIAKVDALAARDAAQGDQ